MNIRTTAFLGLLLLACATPAFAGESSSPTPNGWSGGMMGQGWGAGMMGTGYGQGRGGPGWMMGQGWGSGMMGAGCGMMGYRNGDSGADYDSHVDGRVAFLKAELKITDAQSKVWDDYASAMRTNSQVMINMHKRMYEAFRQNNGSVVRVLDLQIDGMKSHLASLERLKPATEALYKALSDDQRKKADEILPVMGCM